MPLHSVLKVEHARGDLDNRKPISRANNSKEINKKRPKQVKEN